MAIYKCKMCGGDLSATANENVVECDYCGTQQTIPSGDDEKKVNLFNRANRLRMSSNFEKAGAIYEQIIAEFPEEAEAYWGLCLCNYGIEYVDDPATAKKVPTVHRAAFNKLRKDENYELALEYADMSARIVYQDQAKEIDHIMGEILAISQNEKPYDIFICYKETDSSKNRTIDSVIAQDIYDSLISKGYKVFFARITLEDKLGQQYEPYIFAALNSAKVMLAVGTDYEYYNAVWVKNEWSRFLKLMAADKSKVLIPCYKDIDAYDMPEEFKSFQSQDMGKVGAMQDLIRGIDKLFGKSADQVNTTSTVVIQQTSSNPTTDSLLKRIEMFLADGDFASAGEYCEKVLDIDPECARVYVYRLMVKFNVRQQDELQKLYKPFDTEADYIKSIKFADDVLKREIEGYINAINEELNQASVLFSQFVEAVKNSGRTNKIRQNIVDAKAELNEKKEEYNAEIQRLESFKSEFPKNLDAYKSCCDELNNVAIALSTKKQEKASCESELATLGIFSGARKKELREKIAESESSIPKLVKQSDVLKEKEISLKEKLNGYTSAEAIQSDLEKIRKQSAEFESSRNAEISDLEKTFEAEIEKMKKEGKRTPDEIADRILASESASNYARENEQTLADLSEESADAIKLIINLGGSFKFGKYPKDKEGNVAPVEWRVLAKEDNRALIISKYGIDCRKYNKDSVNVTWENCTLRSWLNNEFINTAFTAGQQNRILKVKANADKNPKHSTDPGNATMDKVFLLSIAEAEKHFTTDESRKCVPTAYAKAQGAYTNGDYKTSSGEATCWWWLRSPGYDQAYAAGVLLDGSVDYRGSYVHGDSDCVRPALWINLDS